MSQQNPLIRRYLDQLDAGLADADILDDERRDIRQDIEGHLTDAVRSGTSLADRASEPSDFSAIGHFGQFVYVSPQHDTVFVRTGPGRGDFEDFDWTELFYFVAERL